MSKIQVTELPIREMIELHGPIADPDSIRCPRCMVWFAPVRGEKCTCHTKYIEDEFAPF